MRALSILLLLEIFAATCAEGALRLHGVQPSFIPGPNNLAATPYMGWSTWPTQGATPTEAKVKSIADYMVANGYLSAGYNFVDVDEGWSTGSRDGSGQPLWNTTNFPGGMAALATYIHGDGLKAGIYSDSGSGGGCGALASYGFFNNDFNWFYNHWGYDLLKLDTGGWHNPACATGDYNNGLDPLTVGQMVSQAWASTVSTASILEGPDDYMADNVSWAFYPVNTTAWYVTSDGPAGSGCNRGSWADVVFKFDEALWHPGSVGPYHFPHQDFLYFTVASAENQSQFLYHVIADSPLVLGCDISTFDAGTKALVQNSEVIAINQDSAVDPATLVGGAPPGFITSGQVVAYKHLTTPGTRGVLLTNLDGSPANITFTANDLGLTGTFNVRDTVAQSNLATGVFSYTAMSVASHASMLLKVTAGTENPITSAAVNCGPNGATGAFVANPNVHDGTSQSVVHAIDTSAVSNPAPQAVYEGSRVGQPLTIGAGTLCYGPPGCGGGPDLEYWFQDLQLGATYKVRLHFSENWKTGTGQREFNVQINNQRVLTNFDIYAAAGAQYKAVIEEFTITLTRPLLSVVFSLGASDYPMISGIEVIQQ